MSASHTRDSIDILTAFAPLLAVLVALGVGFTQAYLQRQHLKQQLFEKRFEVYSAVRAFLSVALQSHDSGFDARDYRMFTSKIKPAKYLFGSDVRQLIREVTCLLECEEDGDGRFAFLEADPHIAFGALLNLGHRTEVTFGPYLQLYDETWLLSRWKSRVDKWMEAADILIAKQRYGDRH